MTPDSPAYHLKWSGHTDCGKVRKNNEDSFLGLAVDATGVHHLGKIGEAESGTSDYIFAVSDGMGGAMPKRILLLGASGFVGCSIRSANLD